MKHSFKFRVLQVLAAGLAFLFTVANAYGQVAPGTGPQGAEGGGFPQGQVPAELAGMWSVSSIGTSATIVTFNANGTYRLINSVQSGSMKAVSLETGTVHVQGNNLTMVRQNGTLIQINGNLKSETPLPPAMLSGQWHIAPDQFLPSQRVLWVVYPDGQKQQFYEKKW